ncbi:non-ribosomal peptide synthetase [Pseudonocardia sp. MH-G8]|uniref:non-ribosomal peptide synthetase n=1 Tax=Pseudonocardia sp. MH-G8 TaxID=1854588 RepID=UPI000B9FA3C5|nr:non-ribosomal peptide synthetase [Pseudonocardia sp. MH-G8]OZM83201.1 non-ribosomal peptide synthetase [Pseudonocardia sp. MH-G8]
MTGPSVEPARLLPDPRREVAALLEVDAGELGEDDDLFELGLDSLTVIRLASGWRHRGYPVSFEDLAVEPTIRSWRGVVDGVVAAATPPRSDGVDVPVPAAGTPFPLAPMQHAYWVGRQDGQPFGGVGSHFSLEFDGHDVHPQRLQRAFGALVARHPMLRVRISDDGTQWIGDTTGLPTVTVHDLRDGEDVPERLTELREHITHRRFDIARGEVVELGLTLLPGDATRVHVDLDMMAADALSMSVLLGDLARFYIGAPPEPLDYEFRTFLAERDAGTAGAERTERRERDAQWWGERLADLPGPPELPVLPGAGRPGLPARMGRHHHLVPPEHSAALTAAARKRGLTPAAALATAFSEVVAAWSGSPRFLLNLPLFEREPLHPDVEKLVGDFTGSVLLDVDMGDEQPLVVRAREVQSRLHAVVGHGAYGGVDVLRDLARRSGEPGLAPVVYTSAIGLGEMYDDDVRSAFGDAVWVGSQNPQVWLDAQVREQDGGLLLNWDVREDVLGDTVPAQMFTAYRDLVLRLAGGDERVWDAPVGAMLPDHAVAVREQVNATAPAVPRQALHAAFFAAARTDPGRPAVLGEPGRTGDALTYGELADRALRLAARLAGHGVRPGDAVAISLPRGTDQVVAVLGTLAAGATYVPIGPDQPALRQARILARAEARVLLADAALETAMPVVSPRDLDEQPLPGPLPVSPDDAAYVLFTSGSTGEPKGVEVSHAAAAHTIAAIGARFGVGVGDRTLLVSALEFDLSVYDLFAPLSVGGAVVPLADDERRDPVRWWELVRRHRVSVWNTVPVLLDMLLAGAPADPGDSLRLVLLGGDWVSPELPGRLRAVVPGARFVALGGMTEAAIHSTVQEVPGAPDPDWRAVPWGVPLAGVRCRVVDGRGRDRPDLVTGELWVGGASVARGYRGDPERTADRFVTRDGVRWYRTGDLARYLPDGTLDFLGRADHQVKVRGHRIELGEIESALETHPAVRRAVAVVIGTGSGARLAALVEATADLRAGSAIDSAPVSAQELRDRQTALLPPVMICGTVEVRDALPLTSNGKPDRAAVARLLAAAGPALAEGEPPRGPVEQRLAGVWAELLDVPAVHRTDSFFTLGGDSLLATRLVARLAADGIAGARLGALFGSPRLADFAATLELVEPATVTPQGTRIVPDPANRHEPFPGTDVQAAYWLGRDPAFTLGGVGTWQYAEFDAADVDLPRLERAWDRLVARHEMLRAVLDPDGRHRILRDVPPTRIAVRDVSGAGAEAGERACAELRAECSHRLLDLTAWPLHELRAVRYAGADGEVRTRLAIGLDYILFDALSIMTLFTELDLLYAEPAAHLEPITLSFRDYVLQVEPEPAAVERAQEHWRARLAELPEPPQLPLRIDPADVERPLFTRRRRDLPAERWSELVRRARAEGLTPSTVLLAAYAEVLGAWSGSSALTVTLTLFDRRPVHDDVFRVLGDFTSLTLAGYRPDPGAGWLTAAHELQRRLGEDLDHRDVSPSWLLRELATRTGTLDAAVPVVFTSALGVGDQETPVSMDMSPGFPERVFGISQSPQVSLDNQVLESAGGLQVTWDAVEELFHAGVLDAMFDAYHLLLEHLATADWHGPLPELLPPAQRAVRDRVNATDADLPAGLLHAPFFDGAAARADAPALITENVSVTHGQLADRALRVAAGLAERGVRPGDAVTVTLPKGPEQAVAVLGVLAAGAAYVPVGVDQPPRRRAQVHQAAQARLAITDLGPLLAAEPLAGPVAVSADAPAYVIFTSGSTGAPKGVQVRHSAAGNTVADVTARFGIGPADRVLGVSALDFDLSVYDLFGLLGAGGAVVFPAEDERRDAARWRDLAQAHGVTVWNSVPVLLEMLLVAGLPSTLRLALVSGDWVPVDLPGRAAAAGIRLIAMGGATEGSIWSNAVDATALPAGWAAGRDGGAWGSVPYGFPLANQRYRVVGEDRRDRPDWVPGELWIGGRGVADGYRGDPDRTAERFVTRDGVRWYRTGDVGRYRPDGVLEFLGRADQQVKIGGHRLELGEVETALAEHPRIDRAAVVAVGPRRARRLHAFLVGDPGPDLDAFLAERLPRHAVPARRTVLDALPLTANGKVDRPGLAARAEADGAATGAATGAAPDGELETGIARLWADLLELPAAPLPARDVAFFALGGSSLTTLRLLAAVSERFGAEIPARRFLAAPTVAALAADVRTAIPDADEETGSV